MMLKADADALPSTSLVLSYRRSSADTCLHGKRIIIACHVEIYTIYGLFVCSQMESNGMGSVGLGLWCWCWALNRVGWGWDVRDVLALGT